MSLFDKMKEASDKASKSVATSYKQHQDKVAELKDTRGPKLDAVQIEYMGGYADYKKSKGILVFFQNQTEFKGMMTKFTIPNSMISDVAVEGKSEVNRRVTVTRLLTVGLFAFALKKKGVDKEAYLTIVLSDGQEVIFFADNIAPMNLKVKLAKSISQVKQANPTRAQNATPQAPSSVADELAKLAVLKEKGIITQEEFDKKKAQLLV